jgi:XTP/dITP diphosphohydrolase
MSPDKLIGAKHLLLATQNPGKAREFAALLGPILTELDLELLTLQDLSQLGLNLPSPRENGQSFLENAQIKARYYASLSKLPTLADDSGLGVLALGGAPGPLSARYGGEGLSDRQRAEKLLSDLQRASPTDRQAYFEAALVLTKPSLTQTGPAEELSWTARLEGTLAEKLSGEGGFGYDPIFKPRGFQQTLAELTPLEKNRLSHRGQALKLLQADINQVKHLLKN